METTSHHNFSLRQGIKSDFSSLEDLYSYARNFMSSNGNPNQWGAVWPLPDVTKEDIETRCLYVVIDDKGFLAGAFVLKDHDDGYPGIEGKWLNDDPYLVIHRLASREKGVGDFIFSYLLSLNENLRADTGELNAPMKSLLAKYGFSYCGLIELLPPEKGTRFAYMRAKI